jgi:hypothetical protein
MDRQQKIEKIKKLRAIKEEKARRMVSAPEGDQMIEPNMGPNDGPQPEPSLGERVLGGLQSANQFLSAINPAESIPVVSEVGRMAGAAGYAGLEKLTGDERDFGDIYDAQREAQRAEAQATREEYPIATAGRDFAGYGALGPMGVTSAAGVTGADALLRTGGDVKQAGLEAGMTLATGGLLKGTGKLAAKGVDKLKGSQRKTIERFLDPTASKLGKPEFREQIDYLTDNVLLEAKKQQSKITRDQLRDMLTAKREQAGKTLAKVREREIGLTKKEFSKNLKNLAKTADQEMDRVAKSDFTKAAKSVFPDEYRDLKKAYVLAQKSVESIDDDAARVVSALSKKKAMAVAEKNPEAQKLLEREVSTLEKRYAAIDAKRAEKLTDLERVGEKLTEMEDGKVTLQQLYNQKKNLKRKDFAGEAESHMRKLEDAHGGAELAKAKLDYKRTSELEPMAERAAGQYAKQGSQDLPYVPLGVANKVLKAASRLLPTHKEQLKLAGIKPTSAILKNEKWVNALKAAIDRGASNSGLSVGATIKILQSRDPAFRKAMQEDAEKQQEEE